ncbi:hypothetical protein KIN20_019647 [Parelaphostrongylus tenuis]|uniref:Uncharacterized protein n=1 Tax=Parelaphostrongylus tenuis TaxID=148309 RepID=A0AAD5N2F4_PARTN|nr:hypothetical protein KIN20_019647 [Parelaphostrongylus tenuis]
MGIDINHKHDRKVRRTAPRSEDPYLRILAKSIIVHSCAISLWSSPSKGRTTVDNRLKSPSLKKTETLER